MTPNELKHQEMSAEQALDTAFALMRAQGLNPIVSIIPLIKSLAAIVVVSSDLIDEEMLIRGLLEAMAEARRALVAFKYSPQQFKVLN